MIGGTNCFPPSPFAFPLSMPSLRVGSHTLASRLIVGTGKYATYPLMGEALDASGCDCITVAVRRERLVDADGNNLLDFVDTSLRF